MTDTTSAPPKLSEAQLRVLKWLANGWSAEPGAGSAVIVSGARICNVDTMTAMERAGLAVRGEDRRWSVTEKGKRTAAAQGL